MILENYFMHFTPVGWEEIQEAKAHDSGFCDDGSKKSGCER